MPFKLDLEKVSYVDSNVLGGFTTAISMVKMKFLDVNNSLSTGSGVVKWTVELGELSIIAGRLTITFTEIISSSLNGMESSNSGTYSTNYYIANASKEFSTALLYTRILAIASSERYCYYGETPSII